MASVSSASLAGTRRMAPTSRAARVRRLARASALLSLEEVITIFHPVSSATASTPLTSSAKKRFRMSGITTPNAWLCPVTRVTAFWFGT